MERDPQQRQEEEKVFRAFVDICPNFMHEGIQRWSGAYQDPPDIIAVTVSGKRIGVELTEWFNPMEMALGKRKEKIEQKLEKALLPRSQQYNAPY